MNKRLASYFRPPWGQKDQRGVTLLEVVVSSAVFAIGIVGMARIHVMTSQSDGNSRRYDEASAVAYDLLSYLQSVPFDAADFLVPAGNVYADFLDENPTSMVFRQNDDPDETQFDYDGSVLPDPEVTDSPAPPTMGNIVAPFHGLSPDSEEVEPSKPDFNTRYQRYWRLQEFEVQTDPDGDDRRVMGIAVIVRWRDPGAALNRRVVMFGTRYFPEDILPSW